MKNCPKKTGQQVMFFDLIPHPLPANQTLVSAVADVLGINVDSAYRRIRGDTLLSFDEAIKLSKRFRISMDSFANVTFDKNYIRCRYSPLHLKDMNDYLTFIQHISEHIDRLKTAPGSEIFVSTVDIPLLNLFAYRELTLFKLFSWSKCVYGYKYDFETFVKEKEKVETLDSLHARIAQNYQIVDSTEIWTAGTVDATLRLINYHAEMEHFEDKQFPILLCEQLQELMNKLRGWAEKGMKGPENIPFKFYVSETEIANTCMLFKRPESSACLVRLYTINGLSISDQRFCRETERWIRSAVQRATLISGSSDTARFNFFKTQRQKIKALIDKLYPEIIKATI